ncbi:hypothetical protein KY320_02835 [Candidatus Woesearchaeota archaeon]|nr:hypothetical protein [Candidatus Woesearchaeota archaeon]
MKKKVLCFGNPELEDDAICTQLAKELKIKDVQFIYCSKPEEILDHNLTNLYLMDIVHGLEKVSLITDISRLNQAKSVTAHDFDLGFFLLLMESMNHAKGFKIIGLPPGIGKKAAKAEIIKLLTD